MVTFIPSCTTISFNIYLKFIWKYFYLALIFEGHFQCIKNFGLTGNLFPPSSVFKDFIPLSCGLCFFWWQVSHHPYCIPVYVMCFFITDWFVFNKFWKLLAGIYSNILFGSIIHTLGHLILSHISLSFHFSQIFIFFCS